jgi:hypothetical protein
MNKLLNSRNINLFTSALLLGVGVQQVSAQQGTVQPFHGKTGKTLTDSKEVWP